MERKESARIRRNDDGTQEFMAVMQKTGIGASNSRRLCRTEAKSIFSGLNIKLDSKDHYKFLARRHIRQPMAGLLGASGKNQITQTIVEVNSAVRVDYC